MFLQALRIRREEGKKRNNTRLREAHKKMKKVNTITDGDYLYDNFPKILGNLIYTMSKDQIQKPNQNYFKRFFQRFVHEGLEAKIQKQLGDQNWSAPIFQALDEDDEWPIGEPIYSLYFYEIDILYTTLIIILSSSTSPGSLSRRWNSLYINIIIMNYISLNTIQILILSPTF